MAIDVTVRFRSFLPGGGYDASGRAVQGKTNVRGEVDVTSYTQGGEPLTARDLGLDTIDDLSLTLKEPFTGPNPAQSYRTAGYSLSSAEFYVFEEVSGANNDVEIAGASALKLSFDAFGDSAHNSELL